MPRSGERCSAPGRSATTGQSEKTTASRCRCLTFANEEGSPRAYRPNSFRGCPIFFAALPSASEAALHFFGNDHARQRPCPDKHRCRPCCATGVGVICANNRGKATIAERPLKRAGSLHKSRHQSIRRGNCRPNPGALRATRNDQANRFRVASARPLRHGRTPFLATRGPIGWMHPSAAFSVCTSCNSAARAIWSRPRRRLPRPKIPLRTCDGRTQSCPDR